MERSSKAAPVVSAVAENLASMVGVAPKKSRHSKKSSSEDMDVLLTHLRQTRPFRPTVGRVVQPFSDISDTIFSGLDKYKLRDFVTRHSGRAIRGAVNFEDFEE